MISQELIYALVSQFRQVFVTGGQAVFGHVDVRTAVLDRHRAAVDR